MPGRALKLAVIGGPGWNRRTRLRYAYRFPAAFVPMGLGAEVQLAFGCQALDDWQLALGAQVRPWHRGPISLNVAAGLRVRRYESRLARINNVGANVAWRGRPRWSGAALAASDGSSLTHIENRALREFYPETSGAQGVVRGWAWGGGRSGRATESFRLRSPSPFMHAP